MKIIEFGTITKKDGKTVLSNFAFDAEGKQPSSIAALACVIEELNYAYYAYVDSRIAELTAELQEKNEKPAEIDQSNVVSFQNRFGNHRSDKKL